MTLNNANKKYIDQKTYDELYTGWFFCEEDHPILQGETKDYWYQRLIEMELENEI